MCWHVYYYGVFIAQFVHREHALDFQRYNKHCNIIEMAELPENSLYNDRFTTIEIDFRLRVALAEDWL